jgi:inhibitor of cysteine peptidase
MLVIDKASGDKTVTLRVGESFQIRLPENPATGFRWRLQSDGSPALRLVEDAFQAEASGHGSGGLRNWTFLVDDPTDTVLRFELKRSWQPAAVDSFHVVISAHN